MPSVGSKIPPMLPTDGMAIPRMKEIPSNLKFFRTQSISQPWRHRGKLSSACEPADRLPRLVFARPVVGCVRSGGLNRQSFFHSLSQRTPIVATAQPKTSAPKIKVETKPMNGADVLIEALIRNGGDTIFAYPGGASMPLHQALVRRSESSSTLMRRN